MYLITYILTYLLTYLLTYWPYCRDLFLHEHGAHYDVFISRRDRHQYTHSRWQN